MLSPAPFSWDRRSGTPQKDAVMRVLAWSQASRISRRSKRMRADWIVIATCCARIEMAKVEPRIQ